MSKFQNQRIYQNHKEDSHELFFLDHSHVHDLQNYTNNKQCILKGKPTTNQGKYNESSIDFCPPVAFSSLVVQIHINYLLLIK